MKRNAIIRIVLFSLAIVILLGILAAGLLAGFIVDHIDWDEYEWTLNLGDINTMQGGTEESSFSVDPAKVKNISIDWAAGSVTVVPGSSDQNVITVSESGASGGNMMVWKQSGDTLKIEFSAARVHLGFHFDGSKDLTITVPQNWVCHELELDAASADVHVSDLIINEVDFDGASGDCRFENCQIDELELDTASGRVEFSGILNSLVCDAASADCVIHVANVPRHIEMNSASGDLELMLPESCGFTLDLTALSGSFRSDFATTSQNGNYVFGDGSCRINVSALSGNVNIRKAPGVAEIITP